MKKSRNYSIEQITFVIFKISYNPATQQAEGGVCGSCFFINEKEFITAHHCFNDNVLKPNDGYQKVLVLLINSKGYKIYNPEIKKLYPEHDLTIGKIREGLAYFSSPLFVTTYYIGEKVYNFGYPLSKAIKNYNIQIVGEDLKINNLNISLEKQEGTISNIKIASIIANDIKLENRKIIILDYTSELGFSGGPLISIKTQQVIGFMSLVLPQEVDLKRRAVAIPITEIKHLL